MSGQERPYQTVNRPNGFSPQRFCHPELGESRPANGQPDGICLNRTQLGRLKRIVPHASLISLQNSSFRVGETTIHDSIRGDRKVTVAIPTAIRPPIPPMEIPIGGIRTIGGGTSREATRRAKKKSKRRS